MTNEEIIVLQEYVVNEFENGFAIYTCCNVSKRSKRKYSIILNEAFNCNKYTSLNNEIFGKYWESLTDEEKFLTTLARVMCLELLKY